MTDNKEREAFEAWAIKRLNKHGLPYFLFAKRDGEYMDGGAQHAWDGWQARAALALSQSSEEAVRDEAYETAANKATGFLVGDPLAGIPLRNPMAHEIADAIRALKSAPPQPAEHIEADDTCVICPGCAHQFRAIPVQVQSLMLAAGFEPPFTDAPKEPK